MKSIQWIDRLITEKKLPSDRQAAIMIGMSAQLMSNHRNGRCITLDDKYAYKVEELLNLPHGKIVLDQHAEREKDPNVSAMWRKLASAVAMLVVTICLSGNSEKAFANQMNNSAYSSYVTIHYAQSVIRAVQRLIAFLIKSICHPKLRYPVVTDTVNYGF